MRDEIFNNQVDDVIFSRSIGVIAYLHNWKVIYFIRFNVCEILNKKVIDSKAYYHFIKIDAKQTKQISDEV